MAEPKLRFVGGVRVFKRIVYLLGGAGYRISSVAILALMLVVLANIFLRAFHMPAKGFYEITVLCGLLVYGGSLAYTQMKKTHLRVFLITSRLSQRAQLVIDVIVYFLSIGITSVMVWYSIFMALSFWHAGSTASVSFPIPLYPLMFFIVLCLMLLDLVFIIHLIDTLVNLSESKEK